MASITQTWNNATPAGSDSLSGGDDIIRALKTAIQERLKNGGQYLPDTSSGSSSGVNYVSPDALDASEWNIYGVSAGAPDVSVKLFKLTATALTLHANVATAIAGSLTVGGNSVVTTGSAKRQIVLTACGDVRTTALGDERGRLHQAFMYVPQLNSIGSGTGALTAKLKEFIIIQDTANSGTARTYDLGRVTAATWSSDALTALSFTTLLASAGNLSVGTTGIAARHDDAADFAGAAFPTINGGDVLRATITGSEPGSTLFATAIAVLDVDWP